MIASFEKILYTWYEGYDSRIPVPRQQRIPAFIQLFKDIEANVIKEFPNMSPQELKEEVESIADRNKQEVWDLSVAELKNKGAEARWRSATKSYWKQALAIYNPNENRGEVKAEDLVIKNKVETPDMVIEERPEYIPPEPTPEPEPVFVNVPELDRSIFKGVPGPIVEYDEEFDKLLGFDNERN